MCMASRAHAVLGPMLAVVHPATWLGHQAKGLIGLGFETQCRQGPGGFPDFPNGYLPLRGVNTRIWPTPSNKPSSVWNKDIESIYILGDLSFATLCLVATTPGGRNLSHNYPLLTGTFLVEMVITGLELSEYTVHPQQLLHNKIDGFQI